MNKSIVALATSLLLAAGSASAVELSQGGKGDLLVAPMIMAVGTWQTELKVINTNLADSMVAKVVFHNHTNSAEVLDFLIFLSPGDVWVGTVVVNADGSVGVESSDNSSITLASDPTQPLCMSATGVPGFRPDEAKFKVPTNYAYVNVFETRTISGLGSAPVDKAAIVREYNRLCLISRAGDPAGLAAIGPLQTSNDLVGVATLKNSTNGNKVSLPMTAFSNFDNINYHFVGQLTDFASGADTTNRQLEDALWARKFVFPYENGANQQTLATVTFPTKLTYLNTRGHSMYGPFSAPLGVNVAGIAVRDMEENYKTVCAFSPCAQYLTNELNFISIVTGNKTVNSTGSTIYTENFTKGWVTFEDRKSVV